MRCVFVLMFILGLVCALDNVGWHVIGATEPENMPWKYYTHVVVGAPVVDQFGVATCNKSDTLFPRFVALAKQHGAKLVWRAGIPPNSTWMVVENNSWVDYKKQYLLSISQAVQDCQVDGIEFDYEGPPTARGQAGIINDWQATQFTQFLADIKASLGSDKQVSCDMGVWGITPGSYPLMTRPWVNVSMVNAGAIDYINSMSYHYPLIPGDISPWKKDAYILSDVWGISKSRINLGVPYFFMNGTQEPLWSELSPRCKNIDPHQTYCAGVHIVSKMEHYLIGKFIKEEGFRGAFPWAANYDSLEWNNTLVTWLHRGMTE